VCSGWNILSERKRGCEGVEVVGGCELGVGWGLGQWEREGLTRAS